jgi:hypothetical protein
MRLDVTTMLSRIAAIEADAQTDRGDPVAVISGAFQGTLTLARVLFGPGSTQEMTLVEAAKRARDGKSYAHTNFNTHLKPVVLGTLHAMRGDIEAGLIGDLRRHAVGEVIADIVSLAREAMADGSEGAKNVAAVLAAASFEDTIRKMGSSFANIEERIQLSDVLVALKKVGVLDGAPFTTAQSYLKFRNDALHADWGKLDAAVIGSCISFVEHLLLKHFS